MSVNAAATGASAAQQEAYNLTLKEQALNTRLMKGENADYINQLAQIGILIVLGVLQKLLEQFLRNHPLIAHRLEKLLVKILHRLLGIHLVPVVVGA